MDAHWLISGKKRQRIQAHPDTTNRHGSDSQTILLETQAGYQATFDKETVKVAEAYFTEPSPAQAGSGLTESAQNHELRELKPSAKDA